MAAFTLKLFSSLGTFAPACLFINRRVSCVTADRSRMLPVEALSTAMFLRCWWSVIDISSRLRCELRMSKLSWCSWGFSMLSRIFWFNPELTECSLNNARDFLFLFFFAVGFFCHDMYLQTVLSFALHLKKKIKKNRCLTQRFSWSRTTFLKALYPCLMSRWMQFKLAIEGFVLLVSGPRTLWVWHLLTHHWMQCTKEPFSDLLFHSKTKDASENCLPLYSHLQNSNNQAKTIVFAERPMAVQESHPQSETTACLYVFSILSVVCLGLGLG